MDNPYHKEPSFFGNPYKYRLKQSSNDDESGLLTLLKNESPGLERSKSEKSGAKVAVKKEGVGLSLKRSFSLGSLQKALEGSSRSTMSESDVEERKEVREERIDIMPMLAGVSPSYFMAMNANGKLFWFFFMGFSV